MVCSNVVCEMDQVRGSRVALVLWPCLVWKAEIELLGKMPTCSALGGEPWAPQTVSCGATIVN